MAYRAVFCFFVFSFFAGVWGCSEDVSRDDASRVASGKTPVVQPEEVHGGKALDGSRLPQGQPSITAQNSSAPGPKSTFTDPQSGRMFSFEAAPASRVETEAGALQNGSPQSSLKLILVVASDWNATRGELALFSRDTLQAPWKRLGKPSSCTLGRNGLAWGRGLADPNLPGSRKKEGDGKTPAGVFSLPLAFGYDAPEIASQSGIRMPYLELSPSTVCVTDSHSVAFNDIADSRNPKNATWTRQDRMVRDNNANRLGLFIGHNRQSPKPEAGSCVFLDIQPNQPTGGSIGCSESLLREILVWLDPASNPIIVILPQSVLSSVQSAWGLP